MRPWDRGWILPYMFMLLRHASVESNTASKGRFYYGVFSRTNAAINDQRAPATTESVPITCWRPILKCKHNQILNRILLVQEKS